MPVLYIEMIQRDFPKVLRIITADNYFGHFWKITRISPDALKKEADNLEKKDE